MDPTLETIETFEIPVELTSIVFFFTNIHNIRKAFCGLHVLFTRKTRFIYEHFLNWLVVMYNINNIQWQHVMMDHEEAMISALNIHLPAVQIHLCYFHVERFTNRISNFWGFMLFMLKETFVMHGVLDRMRGGDVMSGRRRTYQRNEDRIQQLKANYEQDHDILVFLTNARLCINN